MILRRVIKHVRGQEWTAVFLDFFIVVTGILIAFQITNWSEAQQAREVERRVLIQLEAEFSEIKSALEKQISVREGWLKNIEYLIITLEGSEPAADENKIKLALDNATSVGRPAAQSATYLQLMANGGLGSLSHEKLRHALVRYDVRLARDAFLHSELLALAGTEMSSNSFVDRNIHSITRLNAEIDGDAVGSVDLPAEFIRSYDLKGLQQFENRYEAIYTLNILLRTADEMQLVLAQDVLDQISGETR